MSDTSLAVRPSAESYGQAGAAIERQGFGAREMERRGDMQATASAELARAQTQARYIVAMQRPRNLDDFRVRMLTHAKRPGFAAIAEYAKPVGGQKIRGMSIRFVEAALQEYGNVLPESVVVYDDDDKRTIRVSVTDLERNVTYSEDATIEKFVERSTPNGEVIGQRTNSYGKTTYKIRATEDDYANKLAARTSKVIRNLGLRILPPDIVDEVRSTCAATRANESAKDPDADRKRMIDAFAGLRIMPSELARYLGHDVATASPAEVDDLRAVYSAIHTGETTWSAVMADAGATDEKKPDPASAKLKKELTKKVKAIEWTRDGDALVTVKDAIDGKVATVEQTGADEWGWWVHVDAQGGAEIASGTAASVDAAKAAAIKAAA